MDISLIHDASKLKTMLDGFEKNAHGIFAYINRNDQPGTESVLWELINQTKELRKHLLKMVSTASNFPEDVEVTDTVFMGNGSWSGYQCERLHDQLESAFSTMSALQQGIGDNDGVLRKSVSKTAKDITLGLTGKQSSKSKSK